MGITALRQQAGLCYHCRNPSIAPLQELAVCYLENFKNQSPANPVSIKSWSFRSAGDRKLLCFSGEAEGVSGYMQKSINENLEI